MIGLIRVVSTLDDAQLRSHADAIAHLVGDEIRTVAIPDQPTGVHDEATFAAAVPKVLALGRRLVSEGARLLIVSCAADPGVPQLRAAVRVPVVGAGSAGAALALALGRAVGVLGITPEVPEAVTQVLGERLIADRVPAGVSSTLDLLRPATRENALVAAEEMREAGAEVILFACTGLTTIGLARDVTARTGLPVVDAVLAAGAVAGVHLHETPTPHQTGSSDDQ